MKIKALTGLLSIMPNAILKPVADKVLDIAENYIGETKTEIDDKILLPAIKGVRNAFGIEDND